MSRVQLALRVGDLEGAIAFYSKLFGQGVAKRRPGYANFAISDPPLKLVLLEGTPDRPTHLDHLGVEVFDPAEVQNAALRLAESGLATTSQENSTCCYAVQDKVWVKAPGEEPWEIYAVLADDHPELEGATDRALSAVGGDGSCCTADESGQNVCC